MVRPVDPAGLRYISAQGRVGLQTFSLPGEQVSKAAEAAQCLFVALAARAFKYRQGPSQQRLRTVGISKSVEKARQLVATDRGIRVVLATRLFETFECAAGECLGSVETPELCVGVGRHPKTSGGAWLLEADDPFPLGRRTSEHRLCFGILVLIEERTTKALQADREVRPLAVNATLERDQ
jgi:hypothetical protein